jgi:hypothetical protein
MTRDVAAQAVHERLEHLASSMPEPDLDAGWAALAAQLEPPVAPVIPLRRPRHRRAVVLGVAAAMLLASGALAMVRHGGGAQGSSERSGRARPSLLRLGPRVHPPFAGPPADHRSAPSNDVGGHQDHRGGGTVSSGGQPSSSDPSGGTSSGSTHGGTHAFHHDSPDDTDHGTGNDGTHDDNGQGNDAQGQDSQGQGSQGNEGSSGGAGNDHGSASGQASGRGTHSEGQGHSGGHGPNA